MLWWLVWPEVGRNDQDRRGRVLLLPLCLRRPGYCPHGQVGVFILEGATSQDVGHFVDLMVLKFPSPSSPRFSWTCWTRRDLWRGPGSFLAIASGVGRFRARHIKIPSVCLDAFHYRVSHSNCRPCLSPSPKAALFPPTFVQPPCERGSVPRGGSSDQTSDSCCLGAAALLSPFACQHKTVAFLLVPGKAPCPWHTSATRSGRRPGPAGVGSPGASWGPQGPRAMCVEAGGHGCCRKPEPR